MGGDTMVLPFSQRVKNAWNAFKDTALDYKNEIFEAGNLSTSRPDRIMLTATNERTVIAPIFNRIAMDVAGVPIKHVRVDDEGQYAETLKSDLNEVLSVSANLDQSGRLLMQDAVVSLFDEGCVAIVPIDTVTDPTNTNVFNIKSLRVAEIVEWFPKSVRVLAYNENNGLHEEVTLPKHMVAIVENPLYAVMNEPNSTLKRLLAKLNLLDAIDNQSGSGKLDLIIQLPYVIKSAARKAQAELRRTSIVEQLTNSKYGIAYTDATEKITQLNRPAENNLLSQVEYLTSMLYSQLGLTPAVFDGTADEAVMLNYYNRTIEPVLSAIIDEMNRKFLTKTARAQKQAIKMIREPFRLVPTEKLAEIADKFTRNEILTSNEFRAIVGFKPSKDPKADELRNKNIPEAKQDVNIEKGEPSDAKQDNQETKI